MKEKILTTVKEKKMLLAPVGVAGATFASALPVFADDPAGNVTTGMTTALGSAFANVQADVITLITTALPYAATIMGIGIALAIGIKQFRRIAK